MINQYNPTIKPYKSQENPDGIAEIRTEASSLTQVLQENGLEEAQPQS